MEKLEFDPKKSERSFRKNYSLHDKAAEIGCSLLIKWAIDFKEFGEDKRYKKLWEKGEDKPDVLVETKFGKALLDWKAKHGKHFLINKRAFNAYQQWMDKLSVPVFVAFFLFNKNSTLIDRRIARIDLHTPKDCPDVQWDKNKTVEFEENIPQFTQNVFLNLIEDWYIAKR